MAACASAARWSSGTCGSRWIDIHLKKQRREADAVVGFHLFATGRRFSDFVEPDFFVDEAPPPSAGSDQAGPIAYCDTTRFAPMTRRRAYSTLVQGALLRASHQAGRRSPKVDAMPRVPRRQAPELFPSMGTQRKRIGLAAVFLPVLSPRIRSQSVRKQSRSVECD